MKQTVFVVIAAGIISGASVSADGNGATVVHKSECTTVGEQTVCAEEMDVFHVTTTPSGILSNQDHVRLVFSIVDPGLTFTDMNKGSFHALFMNGVIHELGSNVRDLYVLDFGGGFVVTCHQVQQFHEVDGDIQYNRSQFVCS